MIAVARPSTPPELYAIQAAMRVKYRREQERKLRPYFNDPEAFVHDAFIWNDGEGPTDYQCAALNAVVEHGRYSGRGPHGLGKTGFEAWLVHWFALTRDSQGLDWKIPTTAGSWRQLTKFLWPEIHKWAKRIRWDVVGRPPYDPRHELHTLNLRLNHGEAFAVTSDNPDLIEGAHADELLYLFDEAKAIPAAMFDAAEGSFSGAGDDVHANAYAAAMSTPGASQGRFYEIHSRAPGYEDWFVQHITLEEAIAAGRISREWAEQRKRQWGADSPIYLNRVGGEFSDVDDDGLIPLSWVEAAVERWYERTERGDIGSLVSVGVDVGLTNDATVIAPRYEDGYVGNLRVHQDADTMKTTGFVRQLLDGTNAYASVDVIGVGAGVVHRLKEQGDRVSAFNAAAGSKRKDRTGELRFLNQRAEAWWRMRELLDPDNVDDDEIAIPPQAELIGDLTAPKWSVTSSGKVVIEKKEEVKMRLGRSTDYGDAVVMAFAPEKTKRSVPMVSSVNR